MHYDNVGRPAHQRVRHNGRTLLDKSYVWGDNLRLLRTLDTINGRSVRYDYDAFGSLSGAVYGDGSRQWRNPDAMGNVYDSPDRTDRSYARGGQLREDRKWRYYYDSHGNLVLKTMRRMEPSRNAEVRDEFRAWQNGDYAYTWQGNGMLRSVTRPDGKTVTFKYDALGRRIEKVFDGREYRYLWDGDVILHEWEYAETDRPNTVVTETGEITLDRPEPVENLITWVYDSDSYVPIAKIVGDKHYSIISDYIGRPVQAYDDNGNVVWQADYDIYGNVRNLHGSRKFIPFRQLGQYEDEETGLYYNRFRYYDPRIGNYISQDPIGLAGSNPTLYGYVFNCNVAVDPLGLMPWGEFMNGASATITAGGHSGVYHSSTAGHAEIKGLNDFANKGWLNGQDVTISDVTGHFSIGYKPVGVCSRCRSDIFGILAENGANSVTLPVTKGNVQVGEYKINSDNFIKVQSEIDKINKGTGTTKTKSDNAWEVLKKYSCK